MNHDDPSVRHDGEAVRRLAVVTGAASGIGRAVAERLIADGTPVFAIDLHEPTGSPAIAAAIAAGTAWAASVDVRDADAVEAAFEQAAAHGELGGLVCCAGVDDGGPSHEFPLDRFERVLKINLFGTFHSIQSALRRFLAQGTPASIVTISSPWATVSPPNGVAAYASSKGAITALTRNLAVEYAGRGIRVNSVTPGATETPLMWANADPADVPELRRQIAAEVPMQRIADPSEPAAAVAWLLSDDARYVTGANLTCDGGALAAGALTL
jgi:NAD(P)-dependent dehydrogenase (short-subunit alcohol dehydrogenase family)